MNATWNERNAADHSNVILMNLRLAGLQTIKQLAKRTGLSEGWISELLDGLMISALVVKADLGLLNDALWASDEAAALAIVQTIHNPALREMALTGNTVI